MHKFLIRIYYEDTDSLGVVYYANYLKFFERARTEFFRKLGYDDNMMEDLFFAVRSCKIKFVSPAKLNDQVDVITFIKVLKKKLIHFEQRIELGGKVLVKSDIRLACISKSGRSVRFPDKVYTDLM